MSKGKQRAKRTSSGARKEAALLHPNRNRRGRAIAKADQANFLRRQNKNRWPTVESLEKAYEMIKVKGTQRRPSAGKIRPAKVGFTLLDMVIDKGKSLDILLTAASLKMKKVRRYPGYVLIPTYNLKNRVIEII